MIVTLKKKLVKFLFYLPIESQFPLGSCCRPQSETFYIYYEHMENMVPTLKEAVLKKRLKRWSGPRRREENIGMMKIQGPLN